MFQKKNIKILGKLTEKLLFFGGIYSNLQALEALKKWADENSYSNQNIFCTGDILGYCAQPIECINFLKNWDIHCIAGNVELQIINNSDDCGCEFESGGRCDLFSKNWFNYIKSTITDEEKNWLKLLPEFIQFTYLKKTFTVVHGSWFNTSDFVFKSTAWYKKQSNFEATQSDIIVAGHCGLPFEDVREGLLWLNAGVIGMPANDGTSRVWFATFDDKNNLPEYTFHALNYDYETAASLMLQNNLPTSYATTLKTGIWDNCEILPEEETLQQGKMINFSFPA